MILGMKVGPQKSSFNDLVHANPPFVEVWFNIARAAEYENLFSELKKRSCKVGLHYWGALPDGTWTNLAYPDAELIRHTSDLMRQTIDIAALNGFSYVNIHPGTRTKVHIDFSTEAFRLLSDPVDLKTSTDLFLENAGYLYKYANDKGVLFTVETVPQRVTKGWKGSEGRSNPYNIHELPLDAILEWARQDGLVANDFCHTASNVITDNADEIRAFVRDMSIRLLPQTRLVHIGYIIPPYNGTDYHGMLNNPQFESSEAVPNKSDMIELLSLFKDTDVFALVEPESDHPGNFNLAKKLLEQSVL